MKRFVLEDAIHAEYVAESDTFEDVLEKAKELAALPWDHERNRCPCSGWKTCERHYVIVEYEVVQGQWSEVERTEIVKISSNGKTWVPTTRVHEGNRDR